MFNLTKRKVDIKLNNRSSKINAIFSNTINQRQLRDLIERFDYLGIDVLILHFDEIERYLSIEIKTVELFTVKRCKKVIETLFSGSAVTIESIGEISYKEYLYKIGA